MADHQPVKEHAQARQMLLDRWFGKPLPTFQLRQPKQLESFIRL
jgi:hypothetical protein